jgi:hypothetical protein
MTDLDALIREIIHESGVDPDTGSLVSLVEFDRGQGWESGFMMGDEMVDTVSQWVDDDDLRPTFR